MQSTQLQKIYTRNIRGQRFTQSSLPLNLVQAIGGQRLWSKGLITITLLLVCFIATLLICFFGASVGLDSVDPYLATSATAASENCYSDPAPSRFILGVIVILGIIVLTQTISKSIMAMGMVLPIVTVLYGVLIFLGAVPSPQMHLFAVVLSTLFVWGVTFLTHCLFRCAIAALDMLFLSPRIIKGMLMLSAFLGAFISSLVSVTFPGGNLDCPSNTASLWAKGVGLAVGITWGLGMALPAWWINHKQRVPWRSPNVFREWALAIGCWSGTSFYNLDLSAVNLQGAVLANTDLRGKMLRRTCFQAASGIERAHVDSRYLDLELPKVQKLLTQGISEDSNYNRLNLQGAFLQGNDLRRLQFIDTNLNGADLSNADLRGAILTRAQVVGTDFSNANLTGICIKDWSVNDQTLFTNVQCDYVYRELDEKGETTDRYPADRNFEPQEFESLYQELGNVAELVFKEGVNWRAFSFSLQKLDLEDEGLGLELKGFERRGDRWVVRVTHNQLVPKQEVESRLLDMYDEMKGLLAAKEDQIHQLLGIASDQAESIKELSQKPFGNSFFITGSTITNLTGSGNIEYTEAAHQVREMVIHGSDRNQFVPIANQFARQLKQQDVATKKTEQLELMQQLIVAEAEADPEFRGYLLKESQQILQAMAGTPLTQVIQGAIKALLPRQ